VGRILVVGRHDDLCCQLVREELAKRGGRVISLDETQLFPGLTFAWELRGSHSRGAVGEAEDTVSLTDIDGVLARFSGFPVTADEYGTPNGQYLCAEWHALARGFVRALSCPVVNRLKPALWYKGALSVLDLASLAPDIPFRLPRVLVTTARDDVRNFYEECGQSLCYSPLGVPSAYIVDTLEDLAKLQHLAPLLPLYLREVISGDRIDAYVVGMDVIWDADELPSPSVETRRGCLEVAASLELTFCQFRLVRTDQGDYYCEGLACMPDLLGCGEEARQAIVGGLADTLLDAQRATL
jgi:hypothetical protein